MLKEYTIADILQSQQENIPYYIGTFEGTDDPDIEWPIGCINKWHESA